MPPPTPVPISSVPYLDVSDLRGREVLIVPLWDGAGWHVWLPAADGLLLPMRPQDAAHSDYAAASAAREDDLYIPFLDLMWQRATWGDIVPRVAALRDDFHHLFSSVAKLRFFHRNRNRISAMDCEGFLMTEVEYMVTTARSVFDLVHEAVSLIWGQYVKLTNPGEERRRRQRKLPRSFTSMVLAGERPTTEASLIERFAIPRALAAAYVRHEPFFSRLRLHRDRIVHGLGRSPRAYLTNRGFAIESDELAFAGVVEWKEADRYSDRLVSVLPWLAQLVLRTIDACTDLVAAFAAQIELPPPLAPGHRLFVRSPHSLVVGELLAAARGTMSWWPDDPAAG